MKSGEDHWRIFKGIQSWPSHLTRKQYPYGHTYGNKGKHGLALVFESISGQTCNVATRIVTDEGSLVRTPKDNLGGAGTISSALDWLAAKITKVQTRDKFEIYERLILLTIIVRILNTGIVLLLGSCNKITLRRYVWVMSSSWRDVGLV